MINKYEKYRLIENFNLDSLDLETENILEDKEINIENLLGSIVPEESLDLTAIKSEEKVIQDEKQDKIEENIVTRQQYIDNIIDENIITTQETNQDPNSEIATSNIVSEEEKKGGGINNKFILIIILFTIFYFLLNPKI